MVIGSGEREREENVKNEGLPSLLEVTWIQRLLPVIVIKL
jgi:hypothetical protein